MSFLFVYINTNCPNVTHNASHNASRYARAGAILISDRSLFKQNARKNIQISFVQPIDLYKILKMYGII